VVKPKNGPLKSDINKNNRGENVDIVDGVEAKEEPKNIEGSQVRKKAVAIKDTSQSLTKPRVVASGQGTFAEQILQIAWANNIKVREDADLVEVLSAIDVDSEIPIEAFAAVAEILAYLYRANSGEIPIDDLNDLKENEQ
jgi:flagellar biosynthesis protein